jgi:hypothetical protein
MTKEFSLKSLAKVNDKEIVVIDNSEQLVPVKPICEILGIAFQSQNEKLKNHPIYSSTIMLSVTVGADGKDREMVCIPFKFLAGWLFSIDARNVNPDVAPIIIKYQLECFNILDYHFRIKPLEDAEFDRIKLERINTAYETLENLRSAKTKVATAIKDAQLSLIKARTLTREQWKSENAQLTIPFIETAEITKTANNVEPLTEEEL